MNICLFNSDEINKPLNIRDKRAQHILNILHKKEGDTFNAGIIDGNAGKATITSINKETFFNDKGKPYNVGEINFSFTEESDGKKLNPLIMIIGFPRPIQLRRLLRDMASLGVMEVHLTATELSEKSYLESDLATTDSGYEMLFEGTQQAASTHIPKLIRHYSLADCLEYIKMENSINSKAALLALDNIKSTQSLTSYLMNNPLIDTQNNTKEAIAAIGSERGWTNDERDLLEKYGFIRLSMGNRIFRTETASTVAASLILSSMNTLN